MELSIKNVTFAIFVVAWTWVSLFCASHVRPLTLTTQLLPPLLEHLDDNIDLDRVQAHTVCLPYL
jgi:hypothetical protein